MNQSLNKEKGKPMTTVNVSNIQYTNARSLNFSHYSLCSTRGCRNRGTECLMGMLFSAYEISKVCTPCKIKLENDDIRNSFKILEDSDYRLEADIRIYDYNDLLSRYRGTGWSNGKFTQTELPFIGWSS